MVARDFTGSSVLIDLEQAKRDAGDRNFIRRAILRASDRLRKRHRDRTRSAPTTRKNFRPSKSMNDSMSDEAKFCSLDRRKSPDIGVQLNEDSKEKAMSILRSVSTPSTSPNSSAMFSKQISIDDAPPVPKKKSPTSSSSSQPVTLTDSRPETSMKNERTLLKPRSKTFSEIPVLHNVASTSKKDQTTKSEEKLSCDLPEQKFEASAINEKTRKLQMTMSPTDKSEIVKLQPRRSTDSVTNNNYKQPQPTNPAYYALSKTKRKCDKKTPTPPPRSPVSLGLPAQTTIFDFPPTNDMPDGRDENLKERKISQISESEKDVKRRTFHSEDLSDDAFASSEPSPLHFDYSNVDYPSEPAYGNIIQMRKDSSDDNSHSSLMVYHPRRYRHSSKHLSDPLSLEAWSIATGDGKQVASLQNFKQLDQLDYINVKTPSGVRNEDSHHGSYVNVSTSESGKPEIGGNLKKGRKHKPAPLNINRPSLKSYKNEFEKYDDDDSSVYHAIIAPDNDSSSSASSIISRRAGGSYENMSLKIGATSHLNHKSDYLNLMSPLSTKTKRNKPSMNYAVLPASSTSPIRGSARSPVEKYNTSDYTRIDEAGTIALNRAKTEHNRQNKQADKQQSGNKTPTKTLK